MKRALSYASCAAQVLGGFEFALGRHGVLGRTDRAAVRDAGQIELADVGENAHIAEHAQDRLVAVIEHQHVVGVVALVDEGRHGGVLDAEVFLQFARDLRQRQALSVLDAGDAVLGSLPDRVHHAEAVKRIDANAVHLTDDSRNDRFRHDGSLAHDLHSTYAVG